MPETKAVTPPAITIVELELVAFLPLDIHIVEHQALDVLGSDALPDHRLYSACHGRHRWLSIRIEADPYIREYQLGDLSLRQAGDVGRCRSAVRGSDIAELQRTEARRHLIDRQRISALHIVGLAVAVAEIEGVHDKGRGHMVHADVREEDAFVHGILATSPPCLHAQAAVDLPEIAVAHREVLDAASSFRAKHDRLMPVVHKAMGDEHIMVAGRRALSIVSLPLFIAMQSSPTENSQPRMRTNEQDSGSMPSVLCKFFGPSILRRSASTWSESTGWMFQAGLFLTVMPARAILLHSVRKIMRGRAMSRCSFGR